MNLFQKMLQSRVERIENGIRAMVESAKARAEETKSATETIITTQRAIRSNYPAKPAVAERPKLYLVK